MQEVVHQYVSKVFLLFSLETALDLKSRLCQMDCSVFFNVSVQRGEKESNVCQGHCDLAENA